MVISWLAIITGVTGLLGLVFILLFFSGRPIFGTLNDIFIGLTAISSALLAWVLSGIYRSGLLGIAAATLGALVVAVGSVLVITGITGWYLAGLYMAAGYALIGLWLVLLNLAASRGQLWPQSLIVFGVVCGLVMLLGAAAVPGIFRGVDESGFTMSPANILWGTGAIGWLALYPIWCILFARVSLLR